MQLDLIRVGQSEKGTFGVLRIGSVPFAVTLERPWLDNQQRVSSIPVGWYVCRRITSPTFGEVFEVQDVPGRSHILFHRGNTIADTEGCILVGEEFAGSLSVPILADSRRGFTELMLILQGVESFDLCIVEASVPHRHSTVV